MYIIVKRETNEPLAINFVTEKVKDIYHFATPRQAKQFMRARRLKDTEWKKIFVTKKEYEKQLENVFQRGA